MWFDPGLKWLEATTFATEIRENEILFPWVESVHVLAITLVVGSISILDLRLLGLASLDRPVGKLTRDVLPCTWVAFAFAAVTGSLLFSAKAGDYAGNFFFRGKLILLVVAALNMGLFHAFTTRGILCGGPMRNNTSCSTSSTSGRRPRCASTASSTRPRRSGSSRE